MTIAHEPHGQLALAYCAKKLPLQVLHSNAGYYIGTFDEEGPCSRESVEYFQYAEVATLALQTGAWTQKEAP